jgi:hypothetical protein
MSHLALPRVRRLALIALGVAITALLMAMYYGNREGAGAAGTPANKVWVDGAKLDVMTAGLTAPGSESKDEVVLAKGQIRFSNPTDLRISATAECALWTNTATTGNDDSEAKARVEMWVTLDGKTVPVSAEDTAADPKTPLFDPADQGPGGHVVFCNRANRMKTEGFDDNAATSDLLIRSYNRSRSANGFNWGALNVGVSQADGGYDDPLNGKNLIDVELHARLSDSLTDTKTADNNGTDSPYAKAAVGKRTMFVEPVKMAQQATAP